MLKKFLFVFINILLIIGILISAEYIIPILEPEYYGIDTIFRKRNFDIVEYRQMVKHRAPIGLEYKKPHILLFGCSYAYSAGVEETQGLGSYLSKYAKRPVSSLAYPGQSIQHAILDVDSGLYDSMIKNSEYVLYLLIGDHFVRTIGVKPVPSDTPYPVLELKDNKYILKTSKFPNIAFSNIVTYLKQSYVSRSIINHNLKFYKSTFNVFKEQFFYFQKRIKEINPNAKIILLIYPDTMDYDYFFSNSLYLDFQEAGISVLNVQNVLPQIWDTSASHTFEFCYPADEYCVSSYDGHPSEKAWELVANMLVNKMNLFK